MLYRLSDSFDSLEPLPFQDAADLQRKEKDLENLIAENLLDLLFEGEPLLPILQQRQRQPEADIYALNREGDLVIFELKRGVAGEDAVLQAIRYAQQAGRWGYRELNNRFRGYLVKSGLSPTDLHLAHQEAFQLDAALEPAKFNGRQHLYVVGNAANEALIDAIDYWKRQGLSAEFLPYRIYKVGGVPCFEFSSFPHDRHRNPSAVRGVLFDTNRSYDEGAVWEMMEKKRVAAYGDARRFVAYLRPGDIVFFYHKWVGLVAAAEVLHGAVKQDGDREQYRSVKFLTPVPDQQSGFSRAMPASDITKVTGRSFFWARTIKVHYLDREEAINLVDKLRDVLSVTS